MKRDHELIPAIMPSSYSEVIDKVSLIVPHVSCVQIDVMDGLFIQSVSWPYRAEDMVFFHGMLETKEMLPALDTLTYEVDLMVERPEEEIPKWYALGARRFIVHFESIEDADVLEQIILTYRRAGVSEVGIALGIETPVESIEPILREIDCVQLMGIAHIGRQGEPFDTQVIDRVKRLRAMYKDGIISVDGGVSVQTVSQLIDAGADRFVSGSAVFSGGDPALSLRAFKEVEGW